MKIAIIGGAGKMGSWFAHFFAKTGHEVAIIDRSKERLFAVSRELGVKECSLKGISKADIVMIAVPISRFEQAVKSIRSLTSENQIIMDIASVKVKPMRLMKKHIRKGRIVGMHPLFGPSAESLAGQSIIITPKTSMKAARIVRRLFEPHGAKVVFMSSKEHDSLMCTLLGLPHMIGLAFAAVARDAGLDGELATTSFRRLFDLSKTISSEDPQLLADIQLCLPSMKANDQFMQVFQKLLSSVKAKDRQAFLHATGQHKPHLSPQGQN